MTWLWQDAELRRYLTRNDYERYKSEYYTVFRNQLKAPVREIPNLTSKLFDYPQVTGVQSPIQIRQDVTSRLNLTRSAVRVPITSSIYNNIAML
jgi:hypothetical protein